MKKTKKIIAILTVLAITSIGGTAMALKDWSFQKSPVEFYAGHSHDEHGATVGAPGHSGGTNRFGCHNGSVPYHCH